MKRVDTFEYVSMLRDLVQEGKEVRLLISGSSMAPFLIHERDTIFFKTPEAPLKPGDMVFYQRKTGQYVMHRIHHITDSGYYIIGDNQTEMEGPLDRDQIFAIVTKVQRKGKMLKPGDFWWEFFAGPWRHMIPLRRILITGYGGIYKIRKKLSSHS